MARENVTKLRARIDSLVEQFRALKAATRELTPSDWQAKLDAFMEESFALETEMSSGALSDQLPGLSPQGLDALTPSEAATYLRTIDDTKVVLAYQLLASKIDAATLAEICLDFLRRRGNGAHNAGAFGLGTCLKGTGNKEASRALAAVARNPDEEADTRLGAYLSLVLINGAKWASMPEKTRNGILPHSELKIVDWSFVDSFL